MSNSYGLSRTIPQEVKFKIRTKSGFGCVLCGGGIIEYEHVDPEYADAKIHDPDCMTLLCPNCHVKKTRGFLSKETIKEAMLKPKTLEVGYSNEFLDLGKESPKIIFAGTIFHNVLKLIVIKDVTLIEIKAPEVQGSPFRLSASFNNSLGVKSLEIVDNEWMALNSNYDVEAIGGKIIIKDKKNQFSLILKTIDSKTIEVEKIDCVVHNRRIYGDRNYFEIFDLATGRSILQMSGCTMGSASVGISLN